MTPRKTSIAFAAITATLCSLAAAPAEAGLVYHAIDLQALTPQSQSFGQGVATGGATGYSYTGVAAEYHAVRSTAGGLQDLGSLGQGLSSGGYGINAAGQVIGFSQTGTDANNPTHAAIFNGSTLVDIGAADPGYTSFGWGINATGQATGSAAHYFDGFGGQRTGAFFYDGSTLHDLGTLGGNEAVGRGINAGGQIAGFSNLTGFGSLWHGFFYDGSTMHDIGALNKELPSYAYAINDAGQVVGSSAVHPGQEHAVLYQGGVLTDLGVLAGGYRSEAFGINNSGTIVGVSNSATSGTTGFVDYGQGLVDLLPLIVDGFDGFQIVGINGINDEGQIVGTATDGHELHAFLFDPFQASQVPEPASAGLALLALLMLRAGRRGQGGAGRR